MHNVEPLVDQWLEAKRQLVLAQEKERTMRDAVVAQLFPDPKRGTNNLTLPDGRIAKYVLKLNIKLSNPDRDWEGIKAAMGGLLPAELVKAKVSYEVSESKYDGLSADQKRFVAGAFEVKNAAPDLKIA